MDHFDLGDKVIPCFLKSTEIHTGPSLQSNASWETSLEVSIDCLEHISEWVNVNQYGNPIL